MPGKRTHRNRDLPRGLYRDAKGYFMVHPVTRCKTRLGPDKAVAFDVHAEVWPRWKNDAASARASRMVSRIEMAADPQRSETVAEYLQRFRSEVLPGLAKRNGKALGATTRYDYDRMLSYAGASEVMSRTRLSDLTPQHIRQALKPWIDKKHYYNYMRAALSRAFSHAVNEGILASNPMKDVGKQYAPKRDVLIPPEHYAAITAKMEPWLSDACDLLYLTSHRPGDVLGLRDEMDFVGEGEDGNVLVRFVIHKTGQPIEIEDNGEIAKVVERLRAYKRQWKVVHPMLIVRISRRRVWPVTVEYLSKRFARAVVDAGYEKGAYQLRDIRPMALTAEAELAGKATDKGGHLTESMKRHYVRRKIPMRVRNNLRAPGRKGHAGGNKIS